MSVVAAVDFVREDLVIGLSVLQDERAVGQACIHQIVPSIAWAVLRSRTNRARCTRGQLAGNGLGARPVPGRSARENRIPAAASGARSRSAGIFQTRS